MTAGIAALRDVTAVSCHSAGAAAGASATGLRLNAPAKLTLVRKTPQFVLPLRIGNAPDIAVLGSWLGSVATVVASQLTSPAGARVVDTEACWAVGDNDPSASVGSSEMGSGVGWTALRSPTARRAMVSTFLAGIRRAGLGTTMVFLGFGTPAAAPFAFTVCTIFLTLCTWIHLRRTGQPLNTSSIARSNNSASAAKASKSMSFHSWRCAGP
mmetsp:Transcript_65648/g.150459  ORF Transcript_65648/g.150459 Transcript_65648/m.150459 type:complete len:212 (+) Transcript_65648:859-1494(+)